MKQYEVSYTVDGKSGYSIMVSAANSTLAIKIAKAEIEEMPGYCGKRINIRCANEIK